MYPSRLHLKVRWSEYPSEIAFPQVQPRGSPGHLPPLSSQAWDMQRQTLQGAGEELGEAGERTDPLARHPQLPGREGTRRAAAQGVASVRPASAQPFRPSAGHLSFLFRLSPSRSPHLSLREETSPRSRAQSFLRDFPENPHELATSPLGVSFQPAPNPSLVLGARIALAQAGNPRPTTDCGSGSRLVPLLRRRTGFLWEVYWPPSRPLQSGMRNLR